MIENNLYIIIGAQRSGTTYLYTIFDEHPEICMAKPLIPEPKFFLTEEYKKGKDFYFKKYFSNKNSNHKIFIEKSTSYYENEIVAKRISQDYKEAKILFLLRDPVERALSNYFFSKKNNLENRSLKEVFLDEKPEPPLFKNISVNPVNYLGRGEFINHIKMYLKYIPSNNFKIIFFNEIINNIDSIQKLYKFLGVDNKFIPSSLLRKINETHHKEKVPVEIIEKLRNYFNPFNKELEEFILTKPFYY